jgi:hypothetical protein
MLAIYRDLVGRLLQEVIGRTSYTYLLIRKSY